MKAFFRAVGFLGVNSVPLDFPHDFRHFGWWIIFGLSLKPVNGSISQALPEEGRPLGPHGVAALRSGGEGQN